MREHAIEEIRLYTCKEELLGLTDLQLCVLSVIATGKRTLIQGPAHIFLVDTSGMDDVSRSCFVVTLAHSSYIVFWELIYELADYVLRTREGDDWIAAGLQL